MGSGTLVQITAIVVYYYSNVVMTLRLNCLQLVLRGEENFYSITVGYTVVVRVPVIDLTGRSLHYLYSSWLNVTPYALQMLLNQFSNFVGCLSCYCGTDEQMLTLLSTSSQSGKDAP